MWKYLKDYVIGKLLDKWIVTTEPSSKTTLEGAFLHYQNIELNTSNFNDSILKNLNFSLSAGTVEELNIDINWKEIFRYWTEIKAKYHIETEDDDEDERDDILENSDNSLIKVKGLLLNLTSFDAVKEYAAEPVIEISPTDVDLMKDFLNHIIGQFKVEIERLTVIINDEIVVTLPNITVLPENNGLRRISVNEDITIKSNNVDGRILKGTEIHIMRTIEGDVIKIIVPGIDIEALNLNTLIELAEKFKLDSSSDGSGNTTVELSIDTFKFTLGPLNLVVHDIWLDSTGSFILGHFNLKFKDYSVIMSPIQTHVITGDYKQMQAIIEEEITVRLKDVKQIEEISGLFTYESKSGSRNTKYQLNIRSIVLVIDEINTNSRDLAFFNDIIIVANADISYKFSHLAVSNIKYIIKSNTISINASSPFAELKRLIENDEIISIEDEAVLYSNFKGLINNLEIENITGSVELEDLHVLTKMISTDNTANTKESSLLMGTINNLQLSLNLSNSVVYQTQFSSISFLGAQSFIDLRANLEYLRRNNKKLMHSADLIAVKTNEITVTSVNNLNLILPYNLNEQLSQDLLFLNSFFTSESKSRVDTNDFQFSLKNLRIKLEAPDDLKEPVESEIFVKEINCKVNVLYVDEAILKLNNESIFNSGLIKINYDSKSIKMMNHCSNVYLTKESYQNMLKFAEFWSEIYSPVIEEIQPEAVFHDESSFDDDDDEKISGTLMQFEGDQVEDFELELELELEETENDNVNGDNISSNNDHHSNTQLTELLKDIDDEFFINKQQEIVNEDSFVKLSNFGIKINLILAESSNENIVISLNGIDGSISSGRINLKVKEGSIHKDTKILMHRWPRGPDVTCRYPIEDANFVSIKADKLEFKNDAGIDEYNLSISVCPLRLFLDQKSLNQMATFFASEPLKNKPNDKLRSFIFFNKVCISPVALKIDYNPNSTVSTAPIPLKGAEMILPRVELRGVKGFEGIGPAVFSAWIPELKGKKLTCVLTTGLVPVRTIVNLGGGVAELILLPWQLGPEQSAAQTVAQIRKNGKRIGLETLKLTASLASQTSKLLSTQKPSSTASYPADFQSGVQQAAQLIIALPTRLSQSNKGALRAVPLIVLDSAATATGALAKTLQGIQAEFDREIDYERKIKRK